MRRDSFMSSPEHYPNHKTRALASQPRSPGSRVRERGQSTALLASELALIASIGAAACEKHFPQLFSSQGSIHSLSGPDASLVSNQLGYWPSLSLPVTIHPPASTTSLQTQLCLLIGRYFHMAQQLTVPLTSTPPGSAPHQFLWFSMIPSFTAPPMSP